MDEKKHNDDLCASFELYNNKDSNTRLSYVSVVSEESIRADGKKRPFVLKLKTRLQQRKAFGAGGITRNLNLSC